MKIINTIFNLIMVICFIVITFCWVYFIFGPFEKKPKPEPQVSYNSINYAEENKKIDCGDYYIVDGQYKEYK